MENIKIVTICGSMKFKKEMMASAEKLELENNYAVIQCVYFEDNNWDDYDLDPDEFEKLHLKKILISDAIYVVNVGGYLGESTKKEIEFAKSLNKEILSLEPLPDLNK